jgi:multidrug efflux pump subunit AcrB
MRVMRRFVRWKKFPVRSWRSTLDPRRRVRARGVPRRNFRCHVQQFAITIATSTVLSSIVALSLTPALCALILKPRDKGGRRGLAGRFFDAFNRRFDRLTEGYARKVQTMIRRTLLSLAMLGIIIFAAFGLMGKVPGGFVPSEDQGYFLGSVQLPAAASLNRTEAVAAKVDDILRLPCRRKTPVINGYNILNGAPQSDSALFVATLKPWAERKTEADSLKSVLLGTYQQAAKLPEASVVWPSIHHPSPAWVQPVASRSSCRHAPAARRRSWPRWPTISWPRRASAPRSAASIRSSIRRTPSFRLEVDREKAKKLGVPISDITNALQTFLGGLNVNDFSRFGRSYKVTMQAEPEYRSDIQQVGLHPRAQCRPADDSAIDAGDAGFHQRAERAGALQPVFARPNSAATRARLQLGRRHRAMEQVAATSLPPGYGFEWSGHQPAGEGIGRQGAAGFRAGHRLRFPVPGRALRELGGAVRRAAGGAARPVRRHARLWLTGLTNNIYAQIGWCC